MAKVRLSSLVQGITGSIGGLTFANTTNGTVLKRRGIKVNQQTRKQLAARALWNRALVAWNALSTSTRNQWIALAEVVTWPTPLGQSRRLSGWQLFHKMYSPYAVATFYSTPLPVAPPTSGTSRQVAQPFLSIAAGNIIRLRYFPYSTGTTQLVGLYINSTASTVRPKFLKPGQLAGWTYISGNNLNQDNNIRAVTGTIRNNTWLTGAVILIEPGKLPSPPYPFATQYIEP